METCTFCDHLFEDMDALVAHLIAEHAGAIPGEFFILDLGDNRTGNHCPDFRIICWCNTWLPSPEEFAIHLQENDGMDAHILDVLLGDGWKGGR